MNKDLDIIFLGGLYPKEQELEIRKSSKSSSQEAANNLQWSLVEGLNKNLNQPVKILNSLYIGSFPIHYNKLFIQSYYFASEKDKLKINMNVGFCNLMGYKNYSRYKTLKKEINEWALNQNKKKKVIIAYAMTSVFVKILEYAKKINQDIHCCLIVPDLPQYMNIGNNKSLIYNVSKKLDMKVINSGLKYVDSYVLLTKQMIEKIEVKRPFVVVEGISTDFHENNTNDDNNFNEKVILYTGGLYEKYGVLDLIDSFNKFPNESYKLILCGSGDAETKIINYTKLNPRIEFKGMLKRNEILELQRKSDILVNPRKNNEEYTKYSFPSKIMEYMSSGTPVLAYYLDGMPEEYKEYFLEIEDKPDGLIESLEKLELKSKEELINIGRSAKNFVSENKSSKIQAEKIIKLIIDQMN